MSILKKYSEGYHELISCLFYTVLFIALFSVVFYPDIVREWYRLLTK